MGLFSKIGKAVKDVAGEIPEYASKTARYAALGPAAPLAAALPKGLRDQTLKPLGRLVSQAAPFIGAGSAFVPGLQAFAPVIGGAAGAGGTLLGGKGLMGAVQPTALGVAGGAAGQLAAGAIMPTPPPVTPTTPTTPGGNWEQVAATQPDQFAGLSPEQIQSNVQPMANTASPGVTIPPVGSQPAGGSQTPVTDKTQALNTAANTKQAAERSLFDNLLRYGIPTAQALSLLQALQKAKEVENLSGQPLDISGAYQNLTGTPLQPLGSTPTLRMGPNTQPQRTSLLTRMRSQGV